MTTNEPYIPTTINTLQLILSHTLHIYTRTYTQLHTHIHTHTHTGLRKEDGQDVP